MRKSPPHARPLASHVPCAADTQQGQALHHCAFFPSPSACPSTRVGKYAGHPLVLRIVLSYNTQAYYVRGPPPLGNQMYPMLSQDILGYCSVYLRILRDMLVRGQDQMLSSVAFKVGRAVLCISAEGPAGIMYNTYYIILNIYYVFCIFQSPTQSVCRVLGMLQCRASLLHKQHKQPINSPGDIILHKRQHMASKFST